MPLVYRIEGPDGYGAFSGPARIHDDQVPGDINRTSYSGPSPWRERDQGNSTIYNAQLTNPYLRFCCISLDQMREWFFNADGCRAMGEAGATLKTYDVPDDHLFVGIKQAVFDPEHATLVSTQCPSELHP